MNKKFIYNWVKSVSWKDKMNTEYQSPKISMKGTCTQNDNGVDKNGRANEYNSR